MPRSDEGFLREFFLAVQDEPLEPDDPRYVDLYEDQQLTDADPVRLMERAITWTPVQSVQLFSGNRGTGKSTELRRLKRRLEERGGYVVHLVDLEEYVSLSAGIDVTDFLLAIAGAFGEVSDGGDQRGYWDRFVEFARRSRIGIEEASLAGGAAGLKLSLRTDPTFRQRLQDHLAGHLGALVDDIRTYLSEQVSAVRQRHPGCEVVLLVDSIDHIRGTTRNEAEVQASVVNLFAHHPDKLHLPQLHVVYTVPPYLRVLYPNVGSLFRPGGEQFLHALPVRSSDGKPDPKWMNVMERVVRQRGEWERLLGDRQLLDRLILFSGGSFRDLLPMLADAALRADDVPVLPPVVDAVIQQRRSEYALIPIEDAHWLRTIADTKSDALVDQSRLPAFARFLDSRVVLCYRNGREWYDIHPLVADEVQRRTS